MNAYELHSTIDHNEVLLDKSKVHGRVSWEITGICKRCSRAHIFRAETQNDYTVYCTSLEKKMPDNIAECTAFTLLGSMSLFDMSQIAHVIELTPEVGFKKEESDNGR